MLLRDQQRRHRELVPLILPQQQPAGLAVPRGVESGDGEELGEAVPRDGDVLELDYDGVGACGGEGDARCVFVECGGGPWGVWGGAWVGRVWGGRRLLLLLLWGWWSVRVVRGLRGAGEGVGGVERARRCGVFRDEEEGRRAHRGFAAGVDEHGLEGRRVALL